MILYDALLVDDDSFANLLSEKVLKNFSPSINIDIAVNGQQALELLKNNPTQDIIIFDYNMPVMNGLEFLREFNRLKIKCNCVSILYTTLSEELIYDLKMNGCNFFIQKPLTEEKLMDLLEHAFIYG
jgi:CheY-like chemotaxis protein